LNILGVHCGHDGGASVTIDGRIAGYVQTERLLRIKHAGGIPWLAIDDVLRMAGLSTGDIELVAVTSTQNRECLFENPEIFSFKYEPNGINSVVDSHYSKTKDNIRFQFGLRHVYENRAQWPDHPNLSQWPFFSELTPAAGYPDRRFRLPRTPLRTAREVKHRTMGMAACTFPISATLYGRSVPGFFVDHHAAHCASAFYKSPYEEALVVSADGSPGGTNKGGFIMFGDRVGLTVVETQEFTGGPFYADVGARIGLDSGKLMGLAGHGERTNTVFDLSSAPYPRNVEAFLEPYGEDAIADATKDPMSRFGQEIATNCQAAFEVAYSTLIKDAIGDLTGDAEYHQLCLTGGCALNCPTNSILIESFGEPNVFIESSCNDEGLAFGAAAWVHACVVGRPVDEATRKANRWPFQGARPRETKAALIRARNFGYQVVDHAPDAAMRIARSVIGNEIGAIMRGQSEIGPRALGHRSIIGVAAAPDHHWRINRIKQREKWRPLGPIVTSDLFGKYFRGPKNPYMLATCEVTTPRTPSARHADGSARTQVLDNDPVLEPSMRTLEKNGKPGVLINTSLNGRRSPMFDDARDLIDFMHENEDLRYALIEDALVSKPGSVAGLPDQAGDATSEGIT
jgi:carbamoyltransferase